MLDIPVYDPARLATLKVRRAQTNEAAAQYRANLVKVIGEIDAAYANLLNRKRQFASACREVQALAEARRNVTENFGEGIVSQVEVLESERSYLQTARVKVVLEEAVLRDHVALVRALGGGCGEHGCAPEITAEPVIRATPIERLLTPRAPRKAEQEKESLHLLKPSVIAQPVSE